MRVLREGAERRCGFLDGVPEGLKWRGDGLP